MPPYDTFVCQGDAYSIIHLFFMITMMPRFYRFVADYPFLCHDRARCMEREQTGHSQLMFLAIRI